MVTNNGSSSHPELLNSQALELFRQYVDLKRQEILSSRKLKSGFDSPLAPKFVDITRCGESNNWCIAVNKQPKPHRSVTGELVGMSVETGKSDSYGDQNNGGNYQLVFISLQTDEGMLKIQVGMIHNLPIPGKNILSALKSCKVEQLQGFLTFQFDPHPGTSAYELKIVNVKAYDAQGTELTTTFPKEKNSGRSDWEIQQYWQAVAAEVYQKVNDKPLLVSQASQASQASQPPAPVQRQAPQPPAPTPAPPAAPAAPPVPGVIQIQARPKPVGYEARNNLIRQIRELTEHSKDDVKEAARQLTRNAANPNGIAIPGELTDEEFDSLVCSLVAGWGIDLRPSPFQDGDAAYVNFQAVYKSYITSPASNPIEGAAQRLQGIKQWMHTVRELASSYSTLSGASLGAASAGESDDF